MRQTNWTASCTIALGAALAFLGVSPAAAEESVVDEPDAQETTSESDDASIGFGDSEFDADEVLANLDRRRANTTETESDATVERSDSADGSDSNASDEDARTAERNIQQHFQKVVRSNIEDIQSCIQTSLHAGQTGRFVLAVTVDDEGSVARVEMTESTIGDDAFRTCVETAVSDWSFPVSADFPYDKRDVTYPFQVRSSE